MIAATLAARRAGNHPVETAPCLGDQVHGADDQEDRAGVGSQHRRQGRAADLEMPAALART
jgi:hypothetical protein